MRASISISTDELADLLAAVLEFNLGSKPEDPLVQFFQDGTPSDVNRVVISYAGVTLNVYEKERENGAFVLRRRNMESLRTALGSVNADQEPVPGDG